MTPLQLLRFTHMAFDYFLLYTYPLNMMSSPNHCQGGNSVVSDQSYDEKLKFFKGH